MAQTFTQVTGKVGVATITQGPGLTNYVTGSRGELIIVELKLDPNSMPRMRM